MDLQRAVGFGALPVRNSEAVTHAHGSNAKMLLCALDAALHVRNEVVLSGDSARFQRAGKCAGQSTRKSGDYVVNRGR